MKISDLSLYRDPRDPRKDLLLEIEKEEGGEVLSGHLKGFDGRTFLIHDGIPNLTWPDELAGPDRESKAVYDSLGADYDKFAEIPFLTFKCNETEVRNGMIDLLHLCPDHHVLEVGCGTGRGSLLIAERLTEGRLFLQEISPPLIDVARKRLNSFRGRTEFSIGNGSYLPFADNSFDALHHFGGLNTFAEMESFFKEVVRVVKPGGRVVVGDEGLGPWLNETEFGKIMANSNPLLKCAVPLQKLPVEAREVTVQWIMLGAYYLLSFTVGEGEPEADYFVDIPSARGGNHWTRYYGQLEGVTDEAKRLAYEAQKRSGISMTQWLTDVVTSAAKKQLGE